MKKSELIKRVEKLESREEKNREDIIRISDDIFSKGTGFFRWAGYFKSDISTYRKIEKILEYLGIEIYKTASEIKVKSIKTKKKRLWKDPVIYKSRSMVKGKK